MSVGFQITYPRLLRIVDTGDSDRLRCKCVWRPPTRPRSCGQLGTENQDSDEHIHVELPVRNGIASAFIESSTYLAEFEDSLQGRPFQVRS
jgi:hypothetical protein